LILAAPGWASVLVVGLWATKPRTTSGCSGTRDGDAFSSHRITRVFTLASTCYLKANIPKLRKIHAGLAEMLV
jgi:hypothetical protein